MVGSPYLLSVILAALELVLLLTGIRRKSIKSLLFYVVLLIGNLGYYAISVSKTVEEAILANKISYLGNIFLPFLMILTLSEFCKTKLPKWGIAILFAATLFVIMLALSVGFSDLYYKEVWISHYKSIFNRNGVTAFHKIYGQWHTTYPVLLFSELAICVVIVWRALKKETRVSRQNAIILLSMFGVALTVYFLQHIFHIKFDYIPYVYVILSALFLNLSLQVQYYDAYNGFDIKMDKSRIDLGFITFNKSLRLMDYTELPAMVYPELRSVRYGDYIFDTESDYYREIHKWLKDLVENNSESGEKELIKDGRYYTVSFEEMSTKVDGLGGILVSISDETNRRALITALEADKKELAKDASTDAMTGLLNKQATESEVEKIASSGAHATVLMLDLDSFKLVNDLHGHATGDKVLIHFAEMMRGIVRATDIVGRIGGDEFIICYKGWQTEESLGRYTEQLNNELAEYAHELLGENTDIPLGVSIGAAFIPQSGNNYAEIKDKADRALYNVKQNGKHGLVVYHDMKTNTVTDETAEIMQPIDHVLTALEERNVLPGSFEISGEILTPVYRIIKRYFSSTQEPCGMVLFSMDKENVNDEKSDAFLTLLQKTLRQKDIVARRKRHSFIAILPDTDEAGSRKAATTITDNWNSWEGRACRVRFDVKTI